MIISTIKKIATYGQDKMDDLLLDAGIIRNKLKVKATVTNAQAFLKIQEEFGSFSKYIWEFVDGKPIKNSVDIYKNAPPNTPLSDALSRI